MVCRNDDNDADVFGGYFSISFCLFVPSIYCGICSSCQQNVCKPFDFLSGLKVFSTYRITNSIAIVAIYNFLCGSGGNMMAASSVA